jgi:hypothetical protein
MNLTTERIRALNDELRRNLPNGHAVMIARNVAPLIRTWSGGNAVIDLSLRSSERRPAPAATQGPATSASGQVQPKTGLDPLSAPHLTRDRGASARPNACAGGHSYVPF